MKNLSVILTVLCLFLCCVSPALAADYGDVDPVWYQVLDFANGDDPSKTPEQEQENAFQVYSYDNATSWVRYTFPGSITCNQVDMLVKVTNASDELVAVQIRNHQDQMAWLDVVSLGSGIYRVYGETSPISSGPYFDLKFHLDDYGTFVTIQSFRILKSPYVSYVNSGSQFPWTLTSDDSYWGPFSGSNVNHIPYFYGYDGTLDETFNYELCLHLGPFKKYDTMTMRVMVGGEINSINVGTGSFALPFTVSSYTNSSVDGSTVYHGTWVSDDSPTDGEFSIAVESFDYGNPVTFLDITVDVSRLAKTSSTPIITINGRYNSRFECVFDVISCGGQVYFATNNPVTYWLKTIGIRLQSGFSSVVDKLDQVYQSLLFLVNGEGSAADQIGGEISQQATEISGAVDDLDSVTKPAVDDLEIDLDPYVPADDMEVVGDVFGQLAGNQLVLPLVMVSLTLSLVSFIIF